MSLPSTFTSADDYFRSCVHFLKTHAWIYRNANTCFLKAGVLECFSSHEMDYFSNIEADELNAFPYVKNHSLKKAPPTSLMEFRTKLRHLIPDEAFQEPAAFQAPAELLAFKKVSLKKQHEIHQLAHLINELCDENEFLIDFGAGLGYLSEMIYQRNANYSRRILGLEADPQRVKAARRRQLEHMPAAKESIVYKQEFITENSFEIIEASAQELLPPTIVQPSWSIIGLHACADLSVTSIRIFFAMSRVKRLIIMPCCYHKLEMLTAQKFRNFPLSKSLQNALDDDDAEQMSRYFNRPFLRLACQQTLERWRCYSSEQHAAHGEQLWQRALAETILLDGEKVVRRRKDQLGESYVDESLTFKRLCAVYELKCKHDDQSLPWQQQHERKFQELMIKYPSGGRLAEGLICLQTTMQKLCENIVLYDRLCYVQECAALKDLKIRTRFVKLMNAALSPRCYALVAEKIA